MRCKNWLIYVLESRVGHHSLYNRICQKRFCVFFVGMNRVDLEEGGFFFSLQQLKINSIPAVADAADTFRLAV